MSDPMPIMAGLVPGSVLLSLWPKGSRARPAPGVVILLAVLVFGLLGATLTVALNAPLGGIASLGLGLMSVGHVAGYLARVPRPSDADLAFEAARQWALRELKRARPALRDSWIESLEAVGGRGVLERWREKAREGRGLEIESTDFNSAERDSGPPFTGDPPRPPALPAGWSRPFRRPAVADEDDEGLDSSEE
jgi:hypothetical protein